MSLKSLNARLAFIFSLVFICFTLALFAATYQLLGSTLAREDGDRFHQLALRFWALYGTWGDELLSEEVFRSEFLDDSQTLVRIADPGGETILFYFPEHFTAFDLASLEQIGYRIAAREQFSGGEPERPTGTLLPDGTGSRHLEALTLTLPDGRILQLGLEVTSRMMVLRQFRLLFTLIAIPFLGLSILGGVLFSRNSLRPVGSLIRTTRSIIETGKLDGRISERGSGDELEELVNLFNRMMEKIETLVTGMRNALDNVAHDLRTPITRLRGRAESALREYGETSGGGTDAPTPTPAAGPEPAIRALKECLEEADRIRSMLSVLMDISEAETGYMKLSLRRIDLAAVLTDMTELYEYAAEDKGITIETGIAGELAVTADEDRIRQVLANLMDNAVKYTQPGGTIAVSASSRRDETGNGRVRIEVSDTGPGISPEELPLIWNRLYRGDNSRSEPGLGLGLSLVKAVVEAHHGSVSAESTPGKGTRFIVELPTSITAL